MVKFFGILLFVFIYPSWALADKTCSIYIHGFTSNNNEYFGDLPRQVHWDSSQNIEEASREVADGILVEMEKCKKGDLIILRPHSYGAAVVFYILGNGKRFQRRYPEHTFVKTYKKTFEVISYTGAYQGTALMNLVCSNSITRFIGGALGKPCVESLLTSTLKGATDYVNNPGVPIYLVHSTDRSGYLGSTGNIIAKSGVSFFNYFFRGIRDQNDNTLPISATRGCAVQKLMRSKNQNCKKINSNYFIDYFHEKNRNHTEFLKDRAFMLMGSVGEK